MKCDIITFGSATRDIFLKSKNFRIVGEKKFITGQGLCLSLGSKIDVADIYFSIGGGGTNTAAAFAKQGFKVAYCGLVSQDKLGKGLVKELKKIGIKTDFISQTKNKITNHSVILSSDGQERTILVYRGASGELTKKDIPWQKLKKARWFYLAPLSGKSARIFGALVDFAKKNKIKVAANPGNSQLSLPKNQLKKILKKVDLLILNQEEASLLANISFQKEKEIFKKLDQIISGICLMTKGPEGVAVSDGKYLYKAGILKTKVVDRTGAGDAFASGFLSGLIKTNDIVFAIQLGMANSASCLRKYGAKEGLLEKGERFEKVKVKREKL